ncbi:hypothetical protein JHK84_052345 [Glycine max]|nr:hypothetical protein JHK84_052345 [Glycine max]
MEEDMINGHTCHSVEHRAAADSSGSIGDVDHLRYLNLCQDTFKTLPKSLCKLWNLQILKLDGCAYLQKLPSKLIQLKALQQLSLIDCDSLSNLPP